MATTDAGDSTTSKTDSTSISSSSTSKFMFRPSALSDVADKMWKKASSDSSTLTSGGNGGINLFSKTPSSGTSNLFTNTASATSSSAFIFGKNISCRVAQATSPDVADKAASSTAAVQDQQKTSASIESEEKTKSASISENDERSGIGFDTLSSADTAASSNGNGAPASEVSSNKVDDTASALEAAAAAYEAAKNQTQRQPQLLPPDEVKTGEEDETNVVHAFVKLYMFDTAKQNWTDRGLAIIRVNDRKSSTDGGEISETRIVVRSQGSLRVIINTKLWPEMLLERVSAKRLRLSGTTEDSTTASPDNDGSHAVSIYLISAGQAADIDRIERALRDRLARMKDTQPSSSVAGKKRPIEHAKTTDTATATSSNIDADVSPAKKREIDDRDA